MNSLRAILLLAAGFLQGAPALGAEAHRSDAAAKEYRAGPLSGPRLVEDPCRYFQVAAIQYPPPRTITRQDYVDWLRTCFERFSGGVYRQVYKVPGMPCAEFVLACAALYDATGEEQYARDALQGFKAFHAGLDRISKPIYVNGAHFAYFIWAWDVLRKHRLVGAADETMFREILRQGIPRSLYASSPAERERDPGNRGLSRGAVLGGTAHLLPDLPQAADWKDYAQKVWNDQWPFRDTCENTSGYNGYWLTILLGYVHTIGFEEKFYRDDGMRRLMERFLYQQSPSGLRPSYGDAGGAADDGLYIGPFELLAAKFRDGRYKWAARRSFDRFRRTILDDHYNYWNTWQKMYASIAMAILFADEALTEVPPDGGSRVAYRKAMELLPPAERTKQLRWWHLQDRQIPDKLILSSGNRFEDLWAMIDLCPYAGHGHWDAPAFLFLTVHGSTLLCDEDYLAKDARYHNLVVVEDLQRTRRPEVEERIEVPQFDEGRETTFARIEVRNYKQFPLTNAREVFFLKNRFLWVRDTLTFEKGFECAAGPQWRARQIGPGIGENYAETYFDILPGDWWGKGREPGRANRFLNPSWNLLVYFLPRPGCTLRIVDESRENIWRHAPQPIQYQWRGHVRAGQKLRFDSLLYPHHPSPDPSAAARRIEVVLDNDEATVLRAEFDLWRKGAFPSLQKTTETIWVALNPGRKPLRAGGLETDATRLYLRLAEGAVKDCSARAATSVRIDGKPLHHSAQPADCDRAF